MIKIEVKADRMQEHNDSYKRRKRMKIRVADYVAKLLVEHGIHFVFTVVGGGAMHLNDALGHCSGISCIYNHHEQASAMAAESYARLEGKMAAACVTTGPGGTNAVTGVLCAWQDSIPLLVLSGQVRSDTTVNSTGLKLRQFGEQEHYIVDTVRGITKYAVTVRSVQDIRYEIEKCIFLAMNGRRGPCWIDIPLDIQGAVVETDSLRGYMPVMEEKVNFDKRKLENRLNSAKKPVIVAGSAVRSAGVYREFLEFIRKLEIPVLAANGCNDILPAGDNQYYGNFGGIGGRAGNFIIQNADLILVLGCRMAFKHIGFNYGSFSPHSFKIVIDVDEQELNKPTLKIDMPVRMDLRDFFLDCGNGSLECRGIQPGWIKYCDELKRKFPIYQEKFKKSNYVNPYYFAEALKKNMPENGIIVVGNSCASDCRRQCGIAVSGQRLWGNTNCGTMGYDLPASIGAAVAGQRDVYCVTGDGSIQMNIQELQTIVHNKLPVKIFVHNNNGYFAIEQTHANFFGRLTGCTPKSGISFPDFSKLAYAYGIPYRRVETHQELDDVLPEFLALHGYGICEVVSDISQTIEPKLKSKALEDGRIVSPPLDDLYPFLNKEVYDKYSKCENFGG